MNSEDDYNLIDNEELKRVGRQNPFAVPEGYFDTLPGHIADRINTPGAGKVIPLKKAFTPAYAAAACAAMLLLLASVYFSLRVPEKGTPAPLAFEEVGNSTYFFDIDEQLLVDELALQSYDEKKAIGNTDMENYLIDNAADISSYYAEDL